MVKNMFCYASYLGQLITANDSLCQLMIAYDAILDYVLQVFALIVEYLAGLDQESRDSLTTILYDDMCHLAQYAKNMVG
jgi:hypothetical protein